MSDEDKLKDEINAAAQVNENEDEEEDDLVIQEMETPQRPVAPSVASSAGIHDADEKLDIAMPTSIPEAEPDHDNNTTDTTNKNNNDANNTSNENAISEDLIPEADFAANIAKPETNNATTTQETENENDTEVVGAAYGADAALIGHIVTNTDVAVTTAASDEDTNNNNNKNNDDNSNVRLEMGSVYDDTNNNNAAGVPKANNVDAELAKISNNAGSNDNLLRNARGDSIYNVEAVPMDAGGSDVHGPIPNLIVELRFDLKLCFQGIEIDDNIAGPLINLRPIVEQRIGQDLMDLVSGVVNEDQRVLLLLTEYNEADQRFYNAAKWGSVGMLALFLIFGVYAVVHLALLEGENITVLIVILAIVIIIAFGLLAYMLYCRQKSKEKEQAWREAVLSQISTEMKNVWVIAANVDDDIDPAANELNIAFSLFYPLQSNSHDKENEIGNSNMMAALRITNGPIIALNKNVQKEAMYDTTADGM